MIQFHFYAPSEHLIEGIRYPMEIHFVHGASDGRMVVIGVLVETGQPNKSLQKILDLAPNKAGETILSQQSIQPSRLLPKQSRHFYSYAGSLTTPPCNEGIQWLVLKEKISASAEQIEIFNTQYYRDNARWEQKLNGRKLDAH